MKFTVVLLIASGLLMAMMATQAEAAKRKPCMIKSVFPWHMNCSERDARPERAVRKERVTPPPPPDEPDKECKDKDYDYNKHNSSGPSRPSNAAVNRKETQ